MLSDRRELGAEPECARAMYARTEAPTSCHHPLHKPQGMGHPAPRILGVLTSAVSLASVRAVKAAASRRTPKWRSSVRDHGQQKHECGLLCASACGTGLVVPPADGPRELVEMVLVTAFIVFLTGVPASVKPGPSALVDGGGVLRLVPGESRCRRRSEQDASTGEYEKKSLHQNAPFQPFELF